MNEYNSDNSREELRERFRQELKRPLSERFYSEDELIVIFDSAGDNYDDYLRAEVLFLGARLYPDSEKLLERRAIFYQVFTSETYNSFVADHPELTGVMGAILKLSVQNCGADEFIAQVEDLLNTYSLDDDEEVIQFVRILNERQLDNWLYEHLDLVKSKISYLPTLYYEIAMNAEAESRTDISIKALEELTNLEPYNADYWTLLASSYLAEQRIDETKQAIEYALAIDPEHFEALKVKLRIIDDTNVEEVNAIFDKLISLEPTNAEMAMCAIQYAEELNDASRIAAILANTMPSCTDSFALAAKAIIHDYPDIETVLANLFKGGLGKNSEDWKNLADVAYAAGQAEAVALIFQMYQEKTGKALDHDFLLMRVLYDMKHYDVAANMFMNAEESGTMRRVENLYKCFGLFVMSLLRTGEIDNAVGAANNMLEMLSEAEALPGSAIERYGMETFLKDVIKRSQAKRPTNWQKYDPLGFDENPLNKI